ncbi:unnamed protein product [Phytophthora lilii]|uniref:Unnamed protein product n=1 Tax=Phytophthora lilii TaxID=2077276 RepID=A0A9W7CMG3_9STRA|nr:unnamed protein product [Phytophthora lilii]
MTGLLNTMKNCSSLLVISVEAYPMRQTGTKPILFAMRGVQPLYSFLWDVMDWGIGQPKLPTARCLLYGTTSCSLQRLTPRDSGDGASDTLALMSIGLTDRPSGQMSVGEFFWALPLASIRASGNTIVRLSRNPGIPKKESLLMSKTKAED